MFGATHRQELPLLSDQTWLTGDAKPLPVLLNPCFREAALMGIGFPFPGPLFASRAGDGHGIAVAVQLHVIWKLRPQAGWICRGWTSGIGPWTSRFRRSRLAQNRSPALSPWLPRRG